MSSKTDQRAQEILRLLLRQGKTSIEELTGILGKSPASVRRDLIRLQERGLVHRTHGGAMLAEQVVYEPFRFDASFQVREDRFAAEKQRIARVAADMILEGETIGLTAGTTTTQVARGLRQRSGLRIITNAVNIGMELSNCTGLGTNLTGGSMRWAGAFSLVGPAALESLNAFIMDRVFIGVCGVDPKRGATTIEPDEAAVFRAMARQAKQVIVVADSSKVGMMSPAVICPPDMVNVLITDDGISKGALEAFTRIGTHVLIA
ncbi:MAG: DeoR family transcriptional regulator, aga operon transcriptional repressor [Acidobacteriaceae bacterium]|jgi:DeoR family transcriptional regulator of aga operon|nr:DeoR family transcriptional regulator, aga operon transcriptional repressor [Acidobacteriaceae bacterium]